MRTAEETARILEQQRRAAADCQLLHAISGGYYDRQRAGMVKFALGMERAWGRPLLYTVAYQRQAETPAPRQDKTRRSHASPRQWIAAGLLIAAGVLALISMSDRAAKFLGVIAALDGLLFGLCAKTGRLND